MEKENLVTMFVDMKDFTLKSSLLVNEEINVLLDKAFEIVDYSAKNFD
jgi:hypothetical protein